MKCPKCNRDEDHVIDSRASEDGSVIRRRRECRNCAARYTTYERIEKSTPLKVLKKRGNVRENFDPAKLRKSIDVVCHKLDIPAKKIEDMTEELVREIEKTYDREVAYHEISEKVMSKLEAINKIAYIRYSSAYTDFENMENFLEDLIPLVNVGEEPSEAKKEDEEEEGSDRLSSSSEKKQ